MHKFILLLVVLTTGAESLKCHSCVDCKDNNSDEITCKEPANSCVNVTVKETIYKGCIEIKEKQSQTEKDLCNLQTLNDSNEKLAKAVKEEHEKQKDTEPTVKCCKKDLCNSAFDHIPSAATMITLPMLVACLFYRY